MREAQDGIAEGFEEAEKEAPQIESTIPAGTHVDMSCITLENGNQVMLGRRPDGGYVVNFVNVQEEPALETWLYLSAAALEALANLYLGANEI